MSDTVATSTCYHCSQPIVDGQATCRTIDAKQRMFCCHGCASVCDMIHESGLSDYYDKARISGSDTFEPPPELAKDIELYDFDEVQQDYWLKPQTADEESDIREINLMADGIHCAACVWLIESRLAQQPAVKLASVNFTNQRIKLRWDNRQLSLSDIIKDIHQVGYKAVPFHADQSIAAHKKHNRDLLFRLGFAGFAMMNVMWFAVALYTGAKDDEFGQYFEYLGFFIATPTLLYAGWPFLKGAYTALSRKRLSMDVSIALGMLSTYFYSSYIAFFSPEVGEVFFDTLIDFIFFLLIGRYLEAVSKQKATDATQRLMAQQPKVARLWQDEKEIITPIQRIQQGDIVLVKPGDQFPVDGLIVEGSAEVDESMLTGESREILKQVGQRVAAGTLNKVGTVKVEVSAVLAQTQLGQIIDLVANAQGSKAPTQQLADKIMPYFVSVTLSIALSTFVFWWFADTLEVAVLAATTVLIITCPCALGLATPMAIAVSTGVASRHGLLVKDGATMENLHQLDHVLFDKTGTLTQGQLDWMDESCLLDYAAVSSMDELLSRIAAIETHSEHTIAQAIVKTAHEREVNFHQWQPHIDEVKTLVGLGVSAQLDGQVWRIGHSQWFETQGLTISPVMKTLEQRIHQAQGTVVMVACENQVLAVLGFKDQLRADAIHVVQQLLHKGIHVSMVTGDQPAVAQHIAQRLDEQGRIHVYAQCKPEQKQQLVQTAAQNHSMVAFVGDGINDAPALASAHIGIAMGSGVDASMDCAQVVLLGGQLNGILTAQALSLKTRRIIKQNMGSSFVYNLLMVPLAASAMLTPLVAAITMPLSSLVVIGNSARLRRFKSRSHFIQKS